MGAAWMLPNLETPLAYTTSHWTEWPGRRRIRPLGHLCPQHARRSAERRDHRCPERAHWVAAAGDVDEPPTM